MLIAQIFLLCMGTICTIFYIYLMRQGTRYDAIVAGLPKKGYSDKELLAVGYALQEFPLFGLDSAVGKKLFRDAATLHPENGGKYMEFWARLYWARTLSMTLMVFCFGFCMATWLEGIQMVAILAVVLVGAYLFYDMGVNDMSNQLKKRRHACEAEFSNMVSKLALLMNCNMILRDAWELVSRSKEGPLYMLMQEACAEMESGSNISDAMMRFARKCDSQEITKFAAVVVQGIQGGADVTQLMRQQSREQWAHRRQIMLQKGDAAAAKLLAPTMIVLIGVVIIVVTASFSGLSFNF